MLEPEERRASVSSVSSISLIEIKAETHLVLQAFLERALSTPHKDRPGRVAGAYVDQNLYRSPPSLTPLSKQKEENDSQAEKEDDKKTGFKDLVKNFPLNSVIRGKGSLGKSSKAKQSHLTEECVSPSSSSDEDESEKKMKLRQAKIKKKLASFFGKKIKEIKEKDKEQRDSPQRSKGSTREKKHTKDLASPDHPPTFYEELAEKLENIARSSTKSTPSSTLPTLTVTDNDEVVNDLVKLLCSEGDAIDTKIQEDSLLRNKLNRMSYRSFKNILDFFGKSQVTQAPPLKPAASPTLQRIAISMDMSRRIVTATGTQRMRENAERYMNTFVPWVKSHGGWENVLSGEDTEEWD
ncbi:uncharacterized protein bcl2l12 [Cyprinodon tularosa]|uniref:uncharacterized protein bcl2l12 n=1 Tax=Cyprinodon tularosa TaxID=77115 RepID=UPI0018E27F63|nr:uncharacterized protein bcl2l12 [Cyprinodon tularosa]